MNNDTSCFTFQLISPYLLAWHIFPIYMFYDIIQVSFLSLSKIRIYNLRKLDVPSFREKPVIGQNKASFRRTDIKLFFVRIVFFRISNPLTRFYIHANPLIFYGLSHVTTYQLSKGRQFIVQDLLASLGLTYSKPKEGSILLRKASTFARSHSLRKA